MEIVRRFTREEAGQTATEYMLILSVVVVAVASTGFASVPMFRDAVTLVGARVKELLVRGA